MKLALVMIVRNEARCLARCLASARPFVDEMIVVDTGSTDATVDIAAAAGARVERFAWCDDFAAARNASLAWSDADWNLILDADTWVLKAPALETRTVLSEGRFIGLVTTFNEFEGAKGLETSTAFEARLLPRGVGYHGRIHEQPATDLPFLRIDVSLGHDGYLAPQRDRKADRNETLLLRSLEAAPGDAYLWYKLAGEYDAAARYPEAVGAFKEALRLSTGAEPWRHSLVVRAINSMTQDGALNEALTLAQGEGARWDGSADFHFALGALFLECASQDEANALTDWLPGAEARWLRCLEIGETPDLAGAVRGRGGHMAAHNLAVLYGTFGPATRAAHFEELAAALRTSTAGPVS